jgi:hypothetical protein
MTEGGEASYVSAKFQRGTDIAVGDQAEISESPAPEPRKFPVRRVVKVIKPGTEVHTHG